MSDALGAMRARVRVQSPLRVADEIGGAAVAWADEGDVWAQIEASGAGVSANYDTAASDAAFRVIVNRRADICAGWRLLWGARVLRVTGVADDGALRMILSCQEQRP